jgi:hypothetical protein
MRDHLPEKGDRSMNWRAVDLRGQKGCAAGGKTGKSQGASWVESERRFLSKEKDKEKANVT